MTESHFDQYIRLFRPVQQAREQWVSTGSDADKARFDAALREYQAHQDCSCPTEGPRICSCTFKPAPHSDATDTTTTHFDSGDTHMPLKSYSQHVADCGGDTREATARFNAEGFASRRPTTAANLRSDSVDEAEKTRRLDSLTAWCTTPEQKKEVQRKIAEQAAQRADMAEHRVQRARFDANTAVCSACESAMPADAEKCPKCGAKVESAGARAERQMKQRNANAWKAPLRGTNQRSAGTIGTSKFDDDGGDAA